MAPPQTAARAWSPEDQIGFRRRVVDEAMEDETRPLPRDRRPRRMSLAWSASAATPTGTPTAADFTRCAGCHSTQAARTRSARRWPAYSTEPALGPRYSYSAALGKNAHLTWNELDKFLQNRTGSSTARKLLASVPDSSTRQRVIAYLKSPQRRPAVAVT